MVLVTVMVLGAEVLFPPIFIAVNRTCGSYQEARDTWLGFGFLLSPAKFPTPPKPTLSGCTSRCAVNVTLKGAFPVRSRRDTDSRQTWWALPSAGYLYQRLLNLDKLYYGEADRRCGICVIVTHNICSDHPVRVIRCRIRGESMSQ